MCITKCTNLLTIVMEKVIIVRYSELAIKSREVRRLFERILIRNIKSSLHANSIKFNIEKSYGRIFVKTENAERACSVLKQVSGIKSVSVSLQTGSDIKAITEASLSLAESWSRGDTFAVRAHRVGKHFFTSPDINNLVGREINRLGFAVDLTCPKRTAFVDIRDDKSYVYDEKISCIGGLPVGSQGTVLAVIKDSGSAIAACLAMKRGCRIVPVFIGRKKKEKYFGMLSAYSSYSITSHHVLSRDDKKEAGKLFRQHRVFAVIMGETRQKPAKDSGFLCLYPLSGLTSSEISAFDRQFTLP